MSMIAGAIVGFYIMVTLLDIAVNWHVNSSPYDD